MTEEKNKWNLALEAFITPCRTEEYVFPARGNTWLWGRRPSEFYEQRSPFLRVLVVSLYEGGFWVLCVPGVAPSVQTASLQHRLRFPFPTISPHSFLPDCSHRKSAALRNARLYRQAHQVKQLARSFCQTVFNQDCRDEWKFKLFNMENNYQVW